MSKEVQNTGIQNQEPSQEPKENETEKKAEKKPNIFKRAWGAIKNGVKAVRESPKAAIIGAAIGTAATIGVTAYLDHRSGPYIQGSLPEPDDGIENEDAGEDYAEGPADDESDE